MVYQCTRFFDDLAVGNDVGKFKRIYKDRYLPALELKNEKNTTQEGPFQDSINVIDTNFLW